MFRKKNKQTLPSRNVRQQQTANVFSYHASRSSGDGSGERRTEPSNTPKLRQAREWVKYTPSFVAGMVLLACLLFVSTLETNPKLQVVGAQRETGLIAGIDSYENDVKAVFEESLLNRSKLLIDTEEIARNLNQNFPELGEVAVVLPLVGRRPVVQVQPPKPALVLGTSQGGFIVDEKGRIIAEAPDIESSVRDKLPVLQDESILELEPGNYALSSDSVMFVREVARQLADKGIPVQSLVLSSTPNELHVRVESRPYYVKFNLRGEGRAQAGTFIATKEKLEAENVTPKQYIDVRVPGKVYYK